MSALAYAGVLAYAVARGRELAPVSAALGGIGALLLLLLLARGADDVLPWTIGCLGAAYAVSLAGHRSGVDEGVPLVAVGLLLCSELAAWSLDERPGIAAERTVVLGRVVGLAVLAGVGLAVATLVAGITAAPLGGGLGWTVLGAAAAVLTVATGAWLVRRSSR